MTAVAFGVGAGGRGLLSPAAATKTVRLWDPATGARVATLLRRTEPRALAMQGAQLAICDYDGVTVVEIASRGM
ncbi:MAG: hypothetical protein GEV28_04485 [Actinophytocola sp.]|uniref:hypothetical protein n=1 Tax=Actinophytocola sp. TaxID=1872138 RepID=UPI001324350B|nr:hypothetical protein [Actinophytocola sp.]MPZ79681.1 hypothetical protein [Actinophytocola sp.]